MSDAPTWYDLLDVSRDASTDEIREAWKTQIADLEPGDRRFDALNRAAKVLLDPAARTAYDAEHPEIDDDEQPLVDEGVTTPVTTPGPIQGLTDLEADRETRRLQRHQAKEAARDLRKRSKEQAAVHPYRGRISR